MIESDHSQIKFTIKESFTPSVLQVRVRYRDVKIRNNFSDLILEEQQYSNIVLPEIRAVVITNVITRVYDMQLSRSQEQVSRSPPWWTKEVLAATKVAARTRQRRCSDPSKVNIANHKQARNLYTWEVRKAKLQIWKEHVSTPDDRPRWWEGGAKWLVKGRRLDTQASSVSLPDGSLTRTL